MASPDTRLISLDEAADLFGVTSRTVRNLIARGTLTGYKIAGLRATRVRLDEVRALVEPIPTTRPREVRA